MRSETRRRAALSHHLHRRHYFGILNHMFPQRYLIIIGLALLAIGAGCQSNSTFPPTTGGIIFESCDFDREGKLFDYRTRSCVIATRANFDRLYHYAFLYQLARKDDRQMEFNVIFRSDLRPRDIISILSLTLAPEDRLTGVLFQLPDAPGGGRSTGSVLSTPKATFVEALEEIEQLTIKNWLARDFVPDDLRQEMVQHLVQRFAQDDYFIRDFDVLAKPSSIMRLITKYDANIETVEELRPEDRITSSPSSPLPLPSFERLMELPEGAP